MWYFILRIKIKSKRCPVMFTYNFELKVTLKRKKINTKFIRRINAILWV